MAVSWKKVRPLGGEDGGLLKAVRPGARHLTIWQLSATTNDEDHSE
jgi:hypothetical protein